MTQTKIRAAFKSRYEEGAGLVRLTGPVTIQTLRDLRAEVFAGVMMNDVERVLCDFSSAVIMLGQEQWAAYTRESLAEHAIAVPIGLLVGSEAAECARLHCNRLNAQGRIALAFLTSLAAYRWLGAPALMGSQAPRREAARG